MEQTLQEFKASTKNADKPKVRKINNSWGVYDYYKYYRVHRPNLHEYVLYESVYFAIIRRVNKLLVEELCRTGNITFPFRMGEIQAYKKTPKTYIRNGKVVSSKIIDWNKTLELWYEDPEAHKNKILVYDDGEHPTARYKKSNAIYKNKYYYEFSLCRDAKLKVKAAFNSDKLKLQEIFSKAEFNKIKGLYDD